MRRKREYLTPAQRLAASVARGYRPRRIEDERALFGLLAAGGARKVLKKGVSIDGDYFAAPELVSFVGKRVEFRRDADPTRVIVYTAEPREFLCIAVNLERLGSAQQQALALASSAVWREMASSIRKTFKSFAKEVGPPAEILLRGTDHAGRIAIATVPFTTPALEAQRVAADAIAAESLLPAPAATYIPDESAEDGGQVITASPEARKSACFDFTDDEAEELFTGIAAGRRLSEREDAFLLHCGDCGLSADAWAQHYRMSSEYAAAVRWGRIRAA